MEHEGVVPEASWSSFDAAALGEDSEMMMAQLLGNQFFADEQEEEPITGMTSMFWPNHDDDPNFSSTDMSYNSYYWPQANSRSSVGNSTSSFLLSAPNYEAYYSGEHNLAPLIAKSSTQMDFFIPGDENNTSYLPISLTREYGSPAALNEEASSYEFAKQPRTAIFSDQTSPATKRKSDMGDDEDVMIHGKHDASTMVSKKKAKASAQTSRRAKNSESKKDQENSNADFNGQSSSCYSSEDDSSASQEQNGGTNASSSLKSSISLNSNGKTRAGRGSATDPQSLYARKRRERINERLRILQNLVPNGTKVDISTMLEEAVQYVKFLQLQIKLLSSDDMWMYAPIAYNGINISLDLNISPPQQ
ncbi:uncharacterized protein [Typha latifolia]|uniref:uncharacterized protein n=1 Tax=Typha latifolia TaxID=4733 RepID=UPI003C30170E